MTNATEFRDDFICNAYLSINGCGLEQQLESAYRALVIRNPREQPGNTDPNAGFVRNDAVLAIVMVTDEEDGSTRDCRFAEAGVPCTDAVGVFDIMSPDWSSSDLNLRFYMYTPGSRQDPTWPIDRYIDPARPTRGFTSLKPGRPDLVIFSAIAGIPLNLRRAPRRPGRAPRSTTTRSSVARPTAPTDTRESRPAAAPSRCASATWTPCARSVWCPRVDVRDRP